MFRRRFLIALAAIAAALVLVAADAHARAGGGFSGGSRGHADLLRAAGHAHGAEHRRADPAQRDAARARPARSARPRRGRASSAADCLAVWRRAFSAPDLFGLLFGHGFFGGMAGFASILGLMLQVVLIVIVARLLFAWWQRRNTPAPAYAAAHPATGHSFSGLGGMFGSNAPAGEPLTIGKSDYDAFERLLGEIQSAYSAEDINALRSESDAGNVVLFLGTARGKCEPRSSSTKSTM